MILNVEQVYCRSCKRWVFLTDSFKKGIFTLYCTCGYALITTVERINNDIQS